MLASSLVIAAGASAHQDGTDHTHGNAPATPPGQSGDNHGQQGGGMPDNPDCDHNGMGCGNASGNCGNNVGVGSGGNDQGYGNNAGACGGSSGCTSNCDPGCTANCDPGCTANCSPGCTANCSGQGDPSGADTPGGGPAAGENAAEAGASNGEAEVLGTSVDAAAGGTATASGYAPSGSLPFTGLKEDLLAALGVGALLMGIAFHMSARRSRRVTTAA